MNTTKLRSKRVIISTIAAVALVGAGATVWTATADDHVGGSERDRVAAAAVEAVGEGAAGEVETSDDAGEAYEVEVRKDDGTEVDVALDEDLEVVGQESDDDVDDSTDRENDRDDRALSADERGSAEEAALEAVGGGTVAKVETSDDGGEAYEVEVRDGDTWWDVSLDDDFEVLSKTVDD